MKKLKILSLFDGISCARVALERAGIPVEDYYASEIDKYAMQISQKNYPDIQQIGSVENISLRGIWTDDDRQFDLLIGGSPCQDLSIAKKNRKGLDGERSGLFWEYVRILNEVKPKYFILENVVSMPKEAKNLITETLGVEPIMINASLVSAQNRKRYFWTNIQGVTQPEDKGITLRDIFKKDIERQVKKTPNLKTTKSGVAWDTSGKGYGSQQDRAYRLDGKLPTIPKSQTLTKINVLLDNGDVVGLTVQELEILQGLPENYTDGILSLHKRAGAVGNAFNVDVVAHILSFIKKCK